MNGHSHLRVPPSERDHAQGPRSAPVTLVEYGDYECPYCGRAYPIVKALQRRFGDTLCFVYRNFPLSEIHPHAFHAAEAAESVAAHTGEREFWRMHDLLFERQRSSPTALDDAHLVSYAAEVGADPGEVREDLIGSTMEARVREDFTSGVRSGVNGTPTFFINGERYDQPWDDLDAFESALMEAAKGKAEIGG